MAKNRKFDVNGCPLELPVPEGTKSGDPVVVGQIPGVALIDRQSNGKATCDTGGVYNLSIKGANKAGNKKIEPGDIIFKKGSELNVNNEEGIRFGYAMEEVASGATTVIPVKIGY